MTTDEERQLQELRTSLLRDRPPNLGPTQGDEAFKQHKVVAMAVHRAAKLAAIEPGSETKAWVSYVTTYFPAGRKGKKEANLTWVDWRTHLVKYDAPGKKIAVTHGQSEIHWKYNAEGRLCLNLEDAWADYEASVDNLIGAMRSDANLRSTVLSEWQKHRWEVMPFLTADPGMMASATVMEQSSSPSASFGTSSSTFSAVGPEAPPPTEDAAKEDEAEEPK